MSDAPEPMVGAFVFGGCGERAEKRTKTDLVSDMVRTGRRQRADDVAAARAVAEAVIDPELPMVTLAELGVLRDVEIDASGTVTVSITPTYSGCPAMAAMRDDLRARLHRAGWDDVEVRTVLHPPWTTNWIRDSGRRKLAEYGIAPPGDAPARSPGRVPLTLLSPVGRMNCPRCGSLETELTSQFSATACKALRRCLACAEPFEHVKPI